ncbi:BUD13 homolog [Anopheles nili]|uniref:BUD13 homolog n=1 Tax=Anopheles nili TaxID=185578 RepID=UPI00237B6A69|nr:BUD13 homolog [Anopheles nili]
MATKIDQKAYLKRYLSNDKDKKKKKKKKDKTSVVKGNVRIIDDDLDISKLQTIQDDEVELFGLGEEAPQVVGIIDDRPPELRAKEDFSSNKWKVLATSDGFDTTLHVKDVSKRTDDSRIGNKSTAETETTTRRGRKDSDESPPRKSGRGNEDSDENPPRRKARNTREDSDESPPRKNKASSSRKVESGSSSKKHSKQYESNASPPRNSRRSDSGESPPRRRKAKASDSDESPPRRREAKLPERRKQHRDSDESPPRRPRDKQRDKRSPRPRHRSHDSDESPPRRERLQDKHKAPIRQDRHRRGSDESPPRKNRHQTTDDRSHRTDNRFKETSAEKSRRRHDSDESPPRRSRNDPGEGPSRRSPARRSPAPRIKQEKNRSDSDLSPPRKPSHSRRRDSDESPTRRRPDRREQSPRNAERNRRRNTPPRRESREPRIKNERRSSSDVSPPRRMTKTLDGKRAGLQDARALREENEKHRRREAEAFEKMSAEHTGRYAETVVREKGGRRRDVEKELREEFEKRKQEEKQKELYARWGKGVKQVEDYTARLQEAAHEMQKPLARYADDKDLDEYLKQQERAGDPMLEYLRNKRKEENKKAGIPEKPTYQGAFPDNRFGIRPGYRWDGVDRTTGYEKRWFAAQSKKKATEEEAYKYSVEDM